MVELRWHRIFRLPARFIGFPIDNAMVTVDVWVRETLIVGYPAYGQVVDLFLADKPAYCDDRVPRLCTR